MHVCARTAYPAFRVERGGVAGVRRARRQRHTASGAVARTLTALALTNEKGRGITAAFLLSSNLPQFRRGLRLIGCAAGWLSRIASSSAQIGRESCRERVCPVV